MTIKVRNLSTDTISITHANAVYESTFQTFSWVGPPTFVGKMPKRHDIPLNLEWVVSEKEGMAFVNSKATYHFNTSEDNFWSGLIEKL